MYIILIFWVFVIFAFSAQPAKQSTEISTQKIATIAVKTLHYVGYRDITKEEVMRKVLQNQVLIRKSAHLLLYFILGLLAGIVFLQYRQQSVYLCLFLALCFCVAQAATDEWHQTFVAGRSGKIGDIFIDAIGATLGIALVWIGRRFRC